MRKEHKLRFLRCDDYMMIPGHLVTAIDGMEFSLDKFRQYQEMLKGNANNLLFVLVNKEDKKQTIHGFLWGIADEIKGTITIYAYSVDKEYQNGKMIGFAKRFLEMIMRKSKGAINNIYLYTTRPLAFENEGASRSKYVLMCLNKEK